MTTRFGLLAVLVLAWLVQNVTCQLEPDKNEDGLLKYIVVLKVRTSFLAHSFTWQRDAGGALIHDLTDILKYNTVHTLIVYVLLCLLSNHLTYFKHPIVNNEAMATLIVFVDTNVLRLMFRVVPPSLTGAISCNTSTEAGWLPPP